MRRKVIQRSAQILSISLLAVAVASCGGSAKGSAEADAEACAAYPDGTINIIVPYDAGGGFDAWARLMAPYLETHLGGGNLVVENQPGGGSLRGVNTVYSAKPDGATLLFAETGPMATAQITGQAIDGFDVENFEMVGTVTKDPFLFYASADSDLESLDDLAEQDEVRHAVQQTLPQDLILYEELGIKPKVILHNGTTDVLLALKRGDADVSRGSLSSLWQYFESGDIRPLAHLGTGEISDIYPGSEYVQGIDNLTTIGREDLVDVFDYRRILFATPETPDCIVDKLGKALADTLSDSEFLSAAKDADLVVVAEDRANTTDYVAGVVSGLEEYSDVLSQGQSN